MKTRLSNNRSLKQNSSRLAAYLATGIGSGIVATPMAEAVIVNIDLTSNGFNITGENAGLEAGYYNDKSYPYFPIYNGGFIKVVRATIPCKIGILGYDGLSFAAGIGKATPTKFTLGQTITYYESWGAAGGLSTHQSTLFQAQDGYNYETQTFIPKSSPDFGPGSYMAFQTALGNLGWLEVTWDAQNSIFQIYSGAYEDEVGVAIAAGATAAVPEPSTIALLALGAAGVALNRRQAKKRQG